MNARLLSLALCAALLPAIASAQDGSHWGAAFSVNPTWKASDNVKVLWNADNGVDIKSTDFAIGLARGRARGGDWSVSYIRKSFKNGSTVDGVETRCDQGVSGCFKSGSFKTLRDTKLSGLLAMKYINFATIKNRVQVGLNVGGGFGTLKGNVDVVDYDVNVSCNNRGQCTGTQTQHATVADAGGEVCGENGDCDRTLFGISKFPIGTVEAAVGVLVAPGVKLRMAGGLDFPGTSSFTISTVYLIGAK